MTRRKTIKLRGEVHRGAEGAASVVLKIEQAQLWEGL